MNKTNKRLSIIMLIILVLNMILPSVSYADYDWGDKSYILGIRLQNMGIGEKRTYLIDGEQLGNYSGSNSILLDTTIAGVYKISVKKFDDNIPFLITAQGTKHSDIKSFSKYDANKHSTSYGDDPLSLATCNVATGAQRLRDAASYGEWVQVFLGTSDKAYTLTYWADISFHEYLKVEVEFVGNTNIIIWDGDTNSADLKRNIHSGIYSTQGKAVTHVWSEHWFRVYPSQMAYETYRKQKGDGFWIAGYEKVSEYKTIEKGMSYPAVGNKKPDNPSFIQKVMTWLVTITIGDTFRGIFTLFFGEVSIDKLLFNDYPNTKLAFYNNGENPLLRDGLMRMVKVYYVVFRKVAITFYLIMLLYIGLRIVMKSTAKDKEKYKAMLMDWVTGVIMLFFFPVVIKYLILLNESLVSYLRTSFNATVNGMPATHAGVSDALLEAMEQWVVEDNSDIMLLFRNKAFNTGNIAYALVYIYLLFKLLMFIIYYFKRFLTIIFLIILFPFVCVSYAIDKIKDGKAQIFNNWFKELLLNIFSQLFQAAIYMIVMGIIGGMITDASGNVVLFCVGIQFVSKSDSLIRALFPTLLGGGGANTASPLSQMMDTAVAVSSAKSLMNKGKKVRDSLKRGNEARKKKSKASDELSIQKSKNQLAEYKDKANNKKLGLPSGGGGGSSGGSGGGGGAPVAADGPSEDAIRESQNAAIANALTGTETKASHKRGETPEVKRAKNEEARKNRMESYQTLAALRAMPATRDRANAAIAEHKRGLSLEEQKRFDANLDMATHTQRALTGKAEDGTKLTQRQIQASVAIVADLVAKAESVPADADSPYKDIKAQYLKRKVKYKTKKLRDELKGLSEKDIRGYQAKYGIDPYKTEEKEMSFKDYFGVGRDGTMGRGLRGKVLSDDGARQLEAGSKLLGGRDGLYTGKQIDAAKGGTGTDSLGYNDTSADDLGYGDAGRIQEPKYDDDGNLISGKDGVASEVTKLSKEELDQAIKDNADIKQQMTASMSGADEQEAKEAADLLIQLGEYTKQSDSGKAISSDEMFRITDRLSKLSEGSDDIKKLVNETISSDAPTGDGPVTMNGGKMQINLGISLQGLRVLSAKTMLTDAGINSEDRAKKVKNGSKGEKEALNKLAENVLQEEYEKYEMGDTIDEVVGAVMGRSDLDDALEEGGSEYFSDSEKGIHRSVDDDGNVRKMEELQRERHQREVNRKIIERHSRAEVEAGLRRASADASLELLSAGLDATVGNVGRIGGSIVGAGLTVGATGEGKVSQVLAGADLGERAVSSITGLPEKGVSAIRRGLSRSTGYRIKGAETDAQAAEAVRRQMISDVMDELNSILS